MKPDLRAEAARIAEADSFAAKRRVLCPFCLGLAANPNGPFGVAALLRVEHQKSPPFIWRYLASKGVKIKRGSIDNHFRARHPNGPTR